MTVNTLHFCHNFDSFASQLFCPLSIFWRKFNTFEVFAVVPSLSLHEYKSAALRRNV